MSPFGLKKHDLIRLLAVAGVIPFAGAALVSLAGPSAWRHIALETALAYGAIITAFMAGAQWGRVQASPGEGGAGELIASNLLALAAWACLLAPAPFHSLALAALAAGLAILVLIDGLALRRGEMGRAYFRLRLWVSVSVLICLSITASGASL